MVGHTGRASLVVLGTRGPGQGSKRTGKGWEGARAITRATGPAKARARARSRAASALSSSSLTLMATKGQGKGSKRAGRGGYLASLKTRAMGTTRVKARPMGVVMALSSNSTSNNTSSSEGGSQGTMGSRGQGGQLVAKVLERDKSANVAPNTPGIPARQMWDR